MQASRQTGSCGNARNMLHPTGQKSADNARPGNSCPERWGTLSQSSARLSKNQRATYASCKLNPEFGKTKPFWKQPRVSCKLSRQHSAKRNHPQNKRTADRGPPCDCEVMGCLPGRGDRERFAQP